MPTSFGRRRKRHVLMKDEETLGALFETALSDDDDDKESDGAGGAGGANSKASKVSAKAKAKAKKAQKQEKMLLELAEKQGAKAALNPEAKAAKRALGHHATHAAARRGR